MGMAIRATARLCIWTGAGYYWKGYFRERIQKLEKKYLKKLQNIRDTQELNSSPYSWKRFEEGVEHSRNWERKVQDGVIFVVLFRK